MCGRVNECAPTCSGADKLQNQGPAGDNTRSTGQKVPEERPIKTHQIKRFDCGQCRHLSKTIRIDIGGTVIISS